MDIHQNCMDILKTCLVFGALDFIFKAIVLYMIKANSWIFLEIYIYRDKLKRCIEFGDLEPIGKVVRAFSNVFQEYIS